MVLVVSELASEESEVVVVVTRQGWGDCWRFDSTEEADEHPLVQYGDAIVAGPGLLPTQYSYLELPRLARQLKMPGLAEEMEAEFTIAASVHPQRGLEAAVARYADRVWSRLVTVARVPPQQPARIVELVREDRRVSKERAMAAAKSAAATKTEDKTKKDAAPAAAGRRSRYADGDKITMLKDAEGKAYGAKNNPKRANSKAAADFEKYKDGMTFKQLAEALGGVSKASNDLAYNEAHNYVTVTKAAA